MEDLKIQAWCFFQGTKACRMNCQSTIQLSRVHFGQGLHWCYALWTWGSLKKFFGNIFSEYLEKGGLPGRSHKIRCETLWVKLKTWYKLVKPKSQIQTFDSNQVQNWRWNSSICQGKGSRDKALGTIWCIVGPGAL